MKRFILLGAMMVASLSAATAFATNYDEAVSGDLSSNRLTPTPIALTVGSNLITATAMSANQPPPTGDLDYFTITVPAGTRLTAINVNSTTTASLVFFAVQAGATMTEPNVGTNPANLLGYTHFGPANGTVGTDILDNLSLGIPPSPAPIGFTPPLPAGQYTFWYQETSSTPTTSQLNFVVTATPVPVPRSAIAASAAGLLLVALRFVRRRARAV
jgi:hypothetical protein